MHTLSIAILALNTLLCVVAGGFHAYWAFGGTLFTDRVLPEYKYNLHPQLFNFHLLPNGRPGPLACLSVTGAFAVYIALLWMNHFGVWRTLTKVLLWIAVAVFTLRATGEHNVVGLFKRERDTLFGHWDTVLYTPFCIWLAVTTAFEILA